VIDKVSRPEIVDPHMHVGDFPLFDVGMNADGLVELFAEWGYAAGIVFHPDNALVRDLVDGIPNAWALYWANPRVEGCADEGREFLAHPKFLGVKMHPLLDSYHPNDPIVHPVAELLVELDMPVLIHSGHPIFTLPWSIEELIVEFPELKVILGHMGHGNIVYINAAIDIAAQDLSLTDNVHCRPGRWHHRFRPHDGCFRLIYRPRVFAPYRPYRPWRYRTYRRWR